MLRDDAIREGGIKPTKEDIKRMNLTKEDLAIIEAKAKKREQEAKAKEKEK